MMNQPPGRQAAPRTYFESLRGLANRIRREARKAMRDAISDGNIRSMSRPVSQGAGDVTFGVDACTESAVSAWLAETAKQGPISLLTEDAGWRHMGPAFNGMIEPLDGFNHGGPRIVIDPIDGTRNLMADLRSAWSVLAMAGPGTGPPNLSDVQYALVSEIPDSRAEKFRQLEAMLGAGCSIIQRSLTSKEIVTSDRLVVDDDDRCDNGYFPFFRYMPDLRPAIADLEAKFFARLKQFEGADVRSCYDDQYISNAGQLSLLALGTYRLIVDARGLLAERMGIETVTSKPYDVAGAILCAREAGCVIARPDGSALDFPLDASTPVSFVGYANNPTAARLHPHLFEVLNS